MQPLEFVLRVSAHVTEAVCDHAFRQPRANIHWKAQLKEYPSRWLPFLITHFHHPCVYVGVVGFLLLCISPFKLPGSCQLRQEFVKVPPAYTTFGTVLKKPI
jgi:hypothetical protein